MFFFLTQTKTTKNQNNQQTKTINKQSDYFDGICCTDKLQINQRYKQLAKKYHPNGVGNNHPINNQIFQEIHKQYDELISMYHNDSNNDSDVEIIGDNFSKEQKKDNDDNNENDEKNKNDSKNENDDSKNNTDLQSIELAMRRLERFVDYERNASRERLPRQRRQQQTYSELDYGFCIQYCNKFREILLRSLNNNNNNNHNVNEEKNDIENTEEEYIVQSIDNFGEYQDGSFGWYICWNVDQSHTWETTENMLCNQVFNDFLFAWIQRFQSTINFIEKDLDKRKNRDRSR